MEYTKDLILNVNYQEIKRHKSIKKAILRHKVAFIALTSTILFVCIDIVLIMNFIELLGGVI